MCEKEPAIEAEIYKKYERLKSKSGFQYSAFGVLALVVYGIVKERTLRKQKHLSTIGGKINLEDTEGKRITEEDFKGKWVMLYFGFTHCPDVCPDTLDRMVEIYKEIKEIAKDETIKLLFITVDPQRDNKESIKEYLKDFDAEFIGLTGTNEEIAQVAKDFHVFYDSHKRGEDEDYLVDHTTLIYLLNPRWRFVDYYALDMELPKVVSKLVDQMKYYKLTD